MMSDRKEAARVQQRGGKRHVIWESTDFNSFNLEAIDHRSLYVNGIKLETN